MSKETIPTTQIAQAIHFFRRQKVLLDFDLAAFYGVATKVLNQAVRRNHDRFPEDFMLRLNVAEVSVLRSQIVSSNADAGGNERVKANRSQSVTGFLKHRE